MRLATVVIILALGSPAARAETKVEWSSDGRFVLVSSTAMWGDGGEQKMTAIELSTGKPATWGRRSQSCITGDMSERAEREAEQCSRNQEKTLKEFEATDKKWRDAHPLVDSGDAPKDATLSTTPAHNAVHAKLVLPGGA